MSLWCPGHRPPAQIEVARAPSAPRTRSRQLSSLIGVDHAVRDRSWLRPPARTPLLGGGLLGGLGEDAFNEKKEMP